MSALKMILIMVIYFGRLYYSFLLLVKLIISIQLNNSIDIIEAMTASQKIHTKELTDREGKVEKGGCSEDGFFLGSMDMLIAAHAVSAGSILITNDRAFYNIRNNDELRLADWCQP